MASSPQLSRLVAGALLGAAAAAACFIEPVRPPAFRADCESNSDCGEGENCVEGLCEIPCTLDLLTLQSDCPDNGDYLTCAGGVCVSACDPENPACPGELSCVEADLGGFGGPVNVCARACSDDDLSECYEGEICFLGTCNPVPPEGDTDGGDTEGDTEGGPP